jgi:two-component system chemotaxis response regulator CheB
MPRVNEGALQNVEEKAVIRVLIVDDMQTIRLQLRVILESDPELRVVGAVGSGEEAVAFCRESRPDIITMDINMPGMGGYEAIRQIMSETPCPIVVITGIESQHLMDVSFKALALGALTVLPKLRGLSTDDAEAKSLIQQVKVMAGVKVVRRTSRPESQPAISGEGVAKPAGPIKNPVPSKLQKPAQLVAIGLSTGGPPALQTILSGLPPSFSLPIVVVQHISPGFMLGLAAWLSNATPFRCKVGDLGEAIKPGTVYLAPDNAHLTFRGNSNLWHDGSEPVDGHRPSATVLFESVAQNFGATAIGLLLTGMGRDGAKGLKAMYEAGAYTIAQDEASSLIFSMPKAAIDLNAVKEVLGLNQIAHRLKDLTETIPVQREASRDSRAG